MLKACLFIALYALLLPSFAQQKALPGMRIDVNSKLERVNGPAISFKDLKGDLVILDFFGTWCVPCLRAIPHLTAISKNTDGLEIVMISNEKQEVLQKFLNARPGFAFPMVQDSDNYWNNIFQPPALPFTAVLNKKGDIITLTDAASITEDSIRTWKVKATGVEGSNESTIVRSNVNAGNTVMLSSNPLIAISQNLLYQVKTGENAQQQLDAIARYNIEALKTQLPDDNSRKAFWINLYNAFTQVALKNNPEQYKDRNSFFKKKMFTVGGTMISLDDIEHGILRKSRTKWSFGYLGKLFKNNTIKELAVDNIDYRIHFALNCGAKSCPPIAFYSNDKIDAQLNLATSAYLKSEAEYNSNSNVLLLPKLMSWFRADFGGKKGIKKIASDLKIIPAAADPKLDFKPYNWQLTLNNYNNQ